MGTKPENFEGDRTKAEDFMEDVKKYMRLNRQVPGFSSPMTKVAMVLTFMKGQATSGWTRAIGDWIDTLDPAIDDQPVVWETFLIAFEQQYVDSQKENRARNKLENLRMKFPEIDEYIATFEDTSRDAGYTMTNPENMQFFLKGLSKGVLADVLRAPIPRTYQEMKTKAIECTNAQQTMSNIMSSLTGGKPFRPFQTSRPQGNQGNQGNWRRQQQQQQQQRQSWGKQPQFNSSNAPPSMNNQSVPMDLSRTRNPNYRGRGRNYRGNVAQTQRPNAGNNACFQCGNEGHYARNCPQKQKARANLIDFDENTNWEETTTMVEDTPQDKVAQLKASLGNLSLEEKEQLAQEMGVTEDFPSA